MCVLQCRCGMVISTPERQTRCIRCGTVLGSEEIVPADQWVTMQPSGVERNMAAPNGEEATRANQDQQEGQQDVLAAYVALVIIAAARAGNERTELR